MNFEVVLVMFLTLLSLGAVNGQRAWPTPVELPVAQEERAQRLGQGLRCPICRGNRL